MQFLLTAMDYLGALERRLAVRSSHIELGDNLRREGKLIFGGAILDEQDKMIGSMLVCDFPDRQALDEWLKIEPYVTSDVWETITIKPFRIGPSFVTMSGAKS